MKGATYTKQETKIRLRNQFVLDIVGTWLEYLQVVLCFFKEPGLDAHVSEA